MKIMLAFLLVLILVFCGTTYVALELDGVLIVRTTDMQSGEVHETHIWYIVTQDGLLLEAGNPRNPWVLDLMSGSTLSLIGDGFEGEYTYRIDPYGHDCIRQLMRNKYGWRDGWIGMLFDVSESKMVWVKPAL